MRVDYYILLWVKPGVGGESPSLKQLDEALGPIFACVLWGKSMGRKDTGQTAIRLGGKAKEAKVIKKLTKFKYEVVGREILRTGPYFLQRKKRR